MMPSKADRLEGFTYVCKINELSESCGKRFMVADVEVAMFKVNGEIFALSNICPHQHSAVIYDGYIEEGCVVCPVHGWMFDLKTGKTPMGRTGLDKYEIRIEKDEIYVKVFKRELKWIDY